MNQILKTLLPLLFLLCENTRTSTHQESLIYRKEIIKKYRVLCAHVEDVTMQVPLNASKKLIQVPKRSALSRKFFYDDHHR